MKSLWQIVGLVWAILVGTPIEMRAASFVDFQRDIQPIFESRCFECHGPKKDKGGLRFDRKATVLNGADSGKPVVVPGKSDTSPLLRHVTSTDPDEMMPPKGERLSEAQIALIKRWIDGGATWPEDGTQGKK